jgi:hypothetical protein
MRANDGFAIIKVMTVNEGRFKAHSFLAADIGLLLWFLSRLYTVGLSVQEPFSLPPPHGEIAIGPRMQLPALHSPHEGETGDSYPRTSEEGERSVESLPEDFLPALTTENTEEGMIDGEAGEVPPPEEQTEPTVQPPSDGEIPIELPPEEFQQDPMADNPNEGMNGGETGEMVAPLQEDQVEPVVQLPLDGDTLTEAPSDEFLQDPTANNQSEGMYGGETGEMIVPSQPEEQTAPNDQPPSDGEPAPEPPPEAPSVAPLPGQDQNLVGPIFGEEIVIPPETDNPPFPE